MDKNLIAILNGTEGTTNVPSAGDTSSDKLISALTDRLTRQGQGVSSSSSSQIQDAITGAMSDIKESGALTDKRLQSERMREVSFARDRAGTTYTAALEGRTGYATQVAGLRELTDTTEKSIRDLDQRYQEAIMSNDANVSSQLAQLRVQKLDFLQKQEESFYNNLFQAAGLTLQQNAQKQAADQFSASYKLDSIRLGLEGEKFLQDRRDGIVSLASQFGITIEPNDTLESIANKVAPIQKRNMSLQQQKLVAEINAANQRLGSEKKLANLNTLISENIAKGMSPSEAVLQAFTDAKAAGIDLSTDDFNSAVESAKASKVKFDTRTEKNAAESGQGFLSRFLSFASDVSTGAGVVKDVVSAKNKDILSEQEERRNSRTDWLKSFFTN